MVYWTQTVSLIVNGLAFIILAGMALWTLVAVGILILEIVYRIKEKLNA